MALLTEGTYPFAMGGVSTWCHELIRGLHEIDWTVLPITSGGYRGGSQFSLPGNALLVDGIEVGDERSLTLRPWHRLPGAVTSAPADESLPSQLAAALLGSDTHLEPLTGILGDCRRNPGSALRAFRSRRARRMFADTLHALTHGGNTELCEPIELTARDVTASWRTFEWLAATAAIPVPDVDLVMCTAAGWPAIIAAATKGEGTPVIVVEHGLYVREACLEAKRGDRTAGGQFGSTRLAVGLSRLAYAIADKIVPVCDAHRPWEIALGGDPNRIRTIVNGVGVPDVPAPPSREQLVVSVGRVDPLKDIVTMLRVARMSCDRDERVQFLHYGPVPEANTDYAAMCHRVHRDLALGERFRFMGPTDDPRRVMRDCAVYLSTSISEGLPLSILEAMSEARPVVATDVGGCAEMIDGCGVLAKAGDASGIALGVNLLLEQPELAEQLGEQAYRRARGRFTIERQLDSFRAVVGELAR